MEGGILKVGGGTAYYFSWVNNSGVMKMSYVELEFVSELNSTIYVEGGTVILEYVSVINQQNYWVAGLVNISSVVAPVWVEVFSCSFINSVYNYGGSSDASYLSRCSPFSFRNETFDIFSVKLNMTSCLFLHNYFNTSGNGFAGTCCFYTENPDSGTFFFFECCLNCVFL
jgi:hypothetical protein